MKPNKIKWEDRFYKSFGIIGKCDPLHDNFKTLNIELKHFISTLLSEQKKEIKEEAIKIIDNIRRFDNKEDGANFFAGWDEAIDLIKSDILKEL